eukprot:gene2170-2591_t
MNEINTERRLRFAAVETAEARKIVTVTRAEGSCEAAHLEGVGLSAMRTAVLRGYAADMNQFCDAVSGTDSKSVLDLLVLTHFIDTVR